MSQTGITYTRMLTCPLRLSCRRWERSRWHVVFPTVPSTSVELVEAHIARIRQTQATLNALVCDRFDAALAEAHAADELDVDSRRHRPLHGVPISVKECFAVQGTVNHVGQSELVTAMGRLLPP